MRLAEQYNPIFSGSITRNICRVKVIDVAPWKPEWIGSAKEFIHIYKYLNWVSKAI